MQNTVGDKMHRLVRLGSWLSVLPPLAGSGSAGFADGDVGGAVFSPDCRNEKNMGCIFIF